MNAKLILKLFFILALFEFWDVNGANPPPTESFPNQMMIKSGDLFWLYWKHDNVSITFEVHVKDSEWFIFGLFSTGYTDTVVGWINNDTIGHFSNRWFMTPMPGMPNVEFNNQTNWIPINATKIDDYILFKFTRNINMSCINPSGNVDVVMGNNTIMFSSRAISSNIGISNVNTDIYDQSLTNLNSIVMENSTLQLLFNYSSFDCVAPVNKTVSFPNPTDNYVHMVDLKEGEVRLYWNFDNMNITAEIHCKTEGWVGVGLSPDGGMEYSDVVIGWISPNGVTTFTDRHVDSSGKVIVDSQQDWYLLGSSKTNGFTILKFTRYIKACDDKDRDVEAGTPYVIWAYGTTPLEPSGDISYHKTNRGSAQVNLITTDNTPNRSNAFNDIEYLDFTISNVILPSDSTFYYCQSFQVPTTLTQKRHILKWELMLPKINIQNIHHFLIYECSSYYTGTPAPNTGNCFQNSLKNMYCYTISFGWAYGGDLVNSFPDTTGYPIGGSTDYKYFVTEIHYNNPEQNLGFIQNIGLRFYTTKTLQPNELGVLTLGSANDLYGITVPPYMDSLVISSQCYSSCTQKHLETNVNYTVVAAFPHTHLIGKAVNTELVRNGKNLGYVFKNDYYNFNFQKNFILNPFVNFQKGDEFITKCTYSSKNRANFTIGGMKTTDEMCFNFLIYYPRVPSFRTCVSYTFPLDFYNLLVDINSTIGYGQPEVNASALNYYEVSAAGISILDGLGASDSVSNMFTSFYNKTQYSTLCGSFANNDYGPFSAIQATEMLKNTTQNACPKSALLNQLTTNGASTLITINYFILALCIILFGFF